MQLRPYQTSTLDAIAATLARGTNRQLIKSPTGTGKTVTFAGLLEHPPLKAWLEQFPKGERKMLVIAHREELLDQSQEKIARANPGKIVTIEQGERRSSRYSDVIVASIQTLAAMKFRRLTRLLEQHRFRVVIVDEAHHAAAASYRTALVHLGFLPPADASEAEEIEAPEWDDVAKMEAALQAWDKQAPRDRLLLGFTATPNRSDAIGLGCVFQTLAYSYDLKRAIDDGYLVPPVPWVVETSESLDHVRTVRGDFAQNDLAEAVNTPRRNRLAVEAWQKYAGDWSTIAFTVDVQHAHDLCSAFTAAGINARAISGETPKDERRQTLEQYRQGRVKVLTNCMVLTEGTDLPMTGCILHAKPTKSATLYEQMTGRGLRLFEGKSECVVIDMVDIASRHSLQTAPVLYGLPPGMLVNGDIQKAKEQLDDLLERFPGFDLDAALKAGCRTLEQLEVRARTFDVWSVPALPAAFGMGRALNWIQVVPDVFRLKYPWASGYETLTVQKDLVGKWEISLTLRDDAGARQRTIAMGVEQADAAAGIAEQFVLQERRSVMKLKDKDAPWRLRPASTKQLAYLRRKNIPHNPKTLTMGQASDLIDLSVARSGR